MWNEPTSAELARIPSLYQTDNIPAAEKIIHEHFFIAGCDWYAAEYASADRLFFGYAILNDDFQDSEWGYFSFDELRAISIQGVEIDRDLDWKQRKASEVERIVQGGGV